MMVRFGLALPFAAALAGGTRQDPATSPRLERLRVELRERGAAAMAAFWSEIAARGAPLVEPDSSHPTERLVTFVWRATEATTNVLILGPAFGGEPAQKRLEQLADTDLWFRTMRLPSDLRTQYRFSVNPPLPAAGGPEQWRDDPNNPAKFIYPKDPDAVESREVIRPLLELPDAAPQPWIARRPGVAPGTVVPHRFTSAILGNTRRVFVYLPAGYAGGTRRYPVLVVFDGAAYIGLVPTPTILDNLIAAHRMQPVVAVLIDNPSPETRSRELDCYRPFADFVVRELMPWVRTQYRVASAPSRLTLAGSSGGGQASMCLAQQYPEQVGAVVAQSGSYFEDPAKPIGSEWVYRNLVERPRLPLRIYLEVGRFEPVPMVTSVRVMRDVLEAKGYPVTYREFAGGHDYAWWRGTLSDGLIAVLGPASEGAGPQLAGSRRRR